MALARRLLHAVALSLILLNIYAGALGTKEDPGPTTGEVIQPSTPGTLRKDEAKQIPFAPPVYASKPRDWGCCRLCLAKDVPMRRKVQFKPNDPSRLVNCCPICPWPSKEKRKMGPLTYYFTKHEPSQQQAYEAELQNFKPGKPEDTLTPGTQTSFLETAASAEGRIHNDPYASIRGMNMDRWENYVYGFPGNSVEMDEPPKPDLPPCCNVCTRYRDNLSVKDNPGCCMQCGLTAGNVQRFPKRWFSDKDLPGHPAVSDKKAQQPGQPDAVQKK